MPECYHHIKCGPRSLGTGTRERKGFSSTPFLVARVGSTQPSTTCDPIKIPGAGQSVSVVVRVQGGEVEEREWQNGSWARERGGSGEVRGRGMG